MNRFKFIIFVVLDLFSLVAVFLLFVYLGMGHTLLLCIGLLFLILGLYDLRTGRLSVLIHKLLYQQTYTPISAWPLRGGILNIIPLLMAGGIVYYSFPLVIAHGFVNRDWNLTDGNYFLQFTLWLVGLSLFIIIEAVGLYPGVKTDENKERCFMKIIKPIIKILVALMLIILLAAGITAVSFWCWTPDTLKEFYGDRTVLNIGHRGASADAPENTLPSFQKAVELGADGVELDVMFSRDREIVVIHDYAVDKTTDGTGKVKDLTLEELRQLDAGAWFSADHAGTVIPTLTEVIEALDEDVLINIEIKSESFLSDGIEKAVADIIARYDLYDRTLVSSFNPVSLIRIKRADSRISTGLIYAPDLPSFLSKGMLIPIAKPDALHPRSDMVDEEYVAKAHTKGYRINAWTVNDEEEMNRLIELGVDGIITDHPGMLKELSPRVN